MMQQGTAARFTGIAFVTAALFVWAACSAGVAQAEEGTYFGEDTVPNYRGQVYSDHAEVQKYIGDEVDVVIPDTIQGKPVTVISSGAFRWDYFDENYDDPETYGYRAMQSVTIPATVTTIEESAFCNNANLKTVTFLNTSTEFTVGDYTFGDCAFTIAEIPYNMRFAEGNPYAGSPIEQFSVAAGHPQLATADDGRLLVNADGDTAIAFAVADKAKTYKIPAQIKTVGDDAFSGARFKTVQLNKVAKVGLCAFERCPNLKVVDLSKKLTTIGARAFASCFKLTEVNVPAGSKLKSVGAHAFYANSKLLQLYLPKSVKKIGEEAFGYYTLELDYESALIAGVCLTVDKGSSKALKYAKAGKMPYIGATKVSKLKPQKRALKVSLKKAAYIPTGYYTKKYQVAYRVKGTSKWKTVKLSGTSTTIKKLKKGKKYEVRARTFKKASGKTVYGAWSPIKTSAKIK